MFNNLLTIKERIKIPHWLVISLTVFFVLVVLWALTVTIIYQLYGGRFFPNIKIGDVNVGGMTYEQAAKELNTKTELMQQQGFVFRLDNQEIIIYPVSFAKNDPDLAREVYSLETKNQIEQAFSFGRNQNFLGNSFAQLKSLFIGQSYVMGVKINKIEFKKILTANFDEFLKKAEETHLTFDAFGEPSIINGVAGEVIDYEGAVVDFTYKLGRGDFSAVELKKKEFSPQVSFVEAEKLLPQIKEILQRGDFFLKATTTDEKKQSIQKKRLITKDEIKKGLIFRWDEVDKKAKLSFKEDVFAEILQFFTTEVEVAAKEARFKMENGRVVEFQAPQVGVLIDVEKTKKEFENNLINLGYSETWIYTKDEPAQTNIGELNNVGIKELVAEGRSNFVGSPPNRIHNIKTGIQALNGLIILPGEEFSLVKALGEISAQTGYLPELVIKGNKTLPEYGGGLCQVATTMFRLGLNSGLEVLERKSHAYRVSYYEPAGSDATIYLPQPDLKLKNNYSTNLLLQTRIEKNEVIFEFWGQKDGRSVEVQKPTIYNITSPGPTQYIETTDIKPGETKCTEKAHNGAETDLKRIITFADGVVKEEVWHSKYRPWQAVCLVGIDPNKVATSTDASIISTQGTD